jgi:hypothetical protein
LTHTRCDNKVSAGGKCVQPISHTTHSDIADVSTSGLDKATRQRLITDQQTQFGASTVEITGAGVFDAH